MKRRGLESTDREDREGNKAGQIQRKVHVTSNEASAVKLESKECSEVNNYSLT